GQKRARILRKSVACRQTFSCLLRRPPGYRVERETGLPNTHLREPLATLPVPAAPVQMEPADAVQQYARPDQQRDGHHLADRWISMQPGGIGLHDGIQETLRPQPGRAPSD